MAKGEGKKTEVHLRPLRIGPPLDKVRRGFGTTAFLVDANLESGGLQLVVGQAHRAEKSVPTRVAVEIR
jgi:hypothetical protein